MTSQPETVRFPFPPPPVPYDPSQQFRDVAAKCPVTKVELPDQSTAWLVTGFREAREMLIDQRFSRALAVADGRPRRGIEILTATGLMSLDPPEHSRYRKLVAAAFAEKRIQALRPRVAQLVSDLIDEMLAAPRPADLVGFSPVVSATAICMLLGVPVSDVHRIDEWANGMFGDWSRPRESIDAAFDAVTGYMAGLIADKRKAPADDLISVLINARDSDGKLSEDELVLFCIGLLAAGHETTANSINMSFVALCQHPEQLARLQAEPELIPAAVEELLRYVNFGGGGAIPSVRITREEVCLGGTTIPAGEPVLWGGAFTNRDPAEFDDPDRLDVGREPKTHLSFGAGAHYCLGAQLARMEMQEAFRGLLTRLPGLRMAIPMSEVEFRKEALIASMRRLPVTWDDA